MFKACAGKKTHLVFDVTGYFLADDSGATFTPLATPVRVLNTGSGVGPERQVRGAERRRPSSSVTAARPACPTTATAVTGNLADRQADQGRLRVGHQGPDRDTGNLDDQLPGRLGPGQRGLRPARRATMPLSIVYNASAGATADVVLDITGYFEPGTAGCGSSPWPRPGSWTAGPTAVLSGLAGKFSSSAPRRPRRSRATGASRPAPRRSLAT